MRKGMAGIDEPTVEVIVCVSQLPTTATPITLLPHLVSSYSLNRAGQYLLQNFHVVLI